MTTTGYAATPGAADAPGVLAYARARRAASDRAEVDVLVAAVDWAICHPPVSDGDISTLPGSDGEVRPAGPGAPGISEFSVIEWAAALGMSTDSGRLFLGEAIELRYRLPRLWARVCAGDLKAWKARMIARTTIFLPIEGAEFVDRHVAGVAHKIGPTQLGRLVEEATARYDPDRAKEQARAAADGRRLEVNLRQVGYDGTVEVHGSLDLADALDLDAALDRGAAGLAAAGSTDSLNVRRSLAAGDLARGQDTLDLTPNTSTSTSTDATPDTTPDTETGVEPKPTRKWRAREVVLYVHLHQDATAGYGDVARVVNTRTLISVEQVRAWCGHPYARVTVKPVIDLAEHVHTEAYEIPDRLLEQVDLRDVTCVFPWCTRPAVGCDHDHITPHSDGGSTATGNIAALCRRHHRIKTHGGWTYTVIEPGSYLWTSRHGYQYLRDHTGTLDVTRPGDSRAHPPDQ